MITYLKKFSNFELRTATSGVGARKRIEEGFDMVTVVPDIDALTNALVGHVKDALGGQLTDIVIAGSAGGYGS